MFDSIKCYLWVSKAINVLKSLKPLILTFLLKLKNPEKIDLKFH